ncbi:hypothetical protein [Pedobacter faecalis]|uniref:hypothetical protein n=1 Tax=Pedobacter faecalis TaxID=3041495 RepID=UPI00254A452C|nr:hypothetical protein [Pedobacter sp. ELA7]
MSIEEVAFRNLKMLIDKNQVSLVKELNQILQTTKSHEVRDSVAKILYCIKHKTSLRAFINAIKNPLSKNHRGYLVLCCEAFDCSNHLLFFIDLTISDNYYTASNALLVIKEMKGPFKAAHYKKAIDKLSFFLDRNKDDEREVMIRDLMDFLVKVQINL